MKSTEFSTQLERVQRMLKGQPLPPQGMLGFPDPEGRESAIPFPYWRATFLFRDVVNQAVLRHFAEEINVRYVPPREDLFAFERWQCSPQ